MKNKDAIKRAHLPTFTVLSMLVGYDEFIRLMGEIDAFKMEAFKIAPEIHNYWKRLGDTKGWKLEYHKDYNYLPGHLKEENIA